FHALYLKINTVDLIKEERLLVNEIRAAVSENKNELEISFLSDFFLYFSDYINASISADDYEYLQNKIEKFRNLWEKYSYYNNNYFDELRPYLELLNAYYGANDKRNEIFLEKLGLRQNEKVSSVGQKEFDDILANANNILRVITGGYHSKGISAILSEKKVSHAVITPYVDGEIETVIRNYENSALRQAGFPAQTLALTLASQASDVKKADLFFNWAQKNLKELSFENNAFLLVEKLNEAAGGTVIFTLDKSEGIVYVKSGSAVKPFAVISKNEDGKIIIQRHVKFSALKAQPQKSVAAKRFLKEFYAIFNIASLNFGSNAFAFNSYPALKNIAVFAAKNNLAFGNGLIFDIAGISQPGETIDGVETRLVARLPDFLQKAVNENRIKKEDFKENNSWLKFLWVSGLLSDFIPSLQRRNKISVFKAVFIAPFSELNQISAAIAAKIQGDERLYLRFIDAHNYDGEQKIKLESGLKRIYDVCVKLSQKNASLSSLKRNMYFLHLSYNFKNIFNTLGQNAVRIFRGEKLIGLAVMTMENRSKRFIVREKTREILEERLSDIIQKFPDAQIERDENKNLTAISIDSQRYERLQPFIRSFFYQGETGGLGKEVNVSLSKAAGDIIYNPQKPQVKELLQQLSLLGVKIGFVKALNGRSYLTLTDTASGAANYSIEIYARGLDENESGAIKQFAFFPKGDGGKISGENIDKLSSLRAFKSKALPEAVDKIISYGKSLSDNPKPQTDAADEVSFDLIKTDARFELLSGLIQLLFDYGPDLKAKLRDLPKANVARLYFENLGITFEADGLRYLNKDSINVYYQGEKVLRIVFGKAYHGNMFHNLTSVIDVSSREKELRREKDIDLFYFLDLLGVNGLSGKENNAQKVLRLLLDYQPSKNTTGHDLSRYQTDGLSDEQFNSLKSIAETAQLQNGGLATFYFKPSKQKEAQGLILKIKENRKNALLSGATDYYLQKNQEAFKRAALGFCAQFFKDGAKADELKSKYAAFIAQDGFYGDLQNKYKISANLDGTYIDIEDGKVFVWSNFLYDADGKPLRYLSRRQINNSSEIQNEKAAEFIDEILN
ncbi:MAG: hypothetical protein LBU09_00760, partial [Endomicrobium sp.]|nr:hypothetical protein [Endomicrobium sp.]